MWTPDVIPLTGLWIECHLNVLEECLTAPYNSNVPSCYTRRKLTLLSVHIALDYPRFPQCLFSEPKLEYHNDLITMWTPPVIPLPGQWIECHMNVLEDDPTALYNSNVTSCPTDGKLTLLNVHIALDYARFSQCLFSEPV